MEQKRKRERSTNFTKSEIRILFELVLKYQSVIENKKTDAVTNRQKDETWNKITNMFNAASNEHVRTAKTLKLKYEGVKKNIKKKMAIHRQELYRTDDEPYAAPDINDVEDKVLAILSNTHEYTNTHEYNDSDNTTNIQIVQDMPFETVNIEEEFSVSDFSDDHKSTPLQESVIYNTDEEHKKDSHSIWRTCPLRFKKSQVLKSNERVSSNTDQLAEAQLELIKLQMAIAKKEHSFVEEEHRRRMLYLKNDEMRKEQIHHLAINKMQQNT